MLSRQAGISLRIRLEASEYLVGRDGDARREAVALRVDNGGQHQATAIDIPDEHQVERGDSDLERPGLRYFCLVGDAGTRTRNCLALRRRAERDGLPRAVLFLERDR